MQIFNKYLVILLAAISWSNCASADKNKWEVGMEYFSWREYFASCPDVLEERGPRFFLEHQNTKHRTDSLDLAFRNRVYGGLVVYDGFTQTCTPLPANTGYLGFKSDLSATYWFASRQQTKKEIVFGAASTLTLDIWRRTILSAAGYSEDYFVGSIFAGLAAKKGKQWELQAGVKYPLITHEIVRLSDAGFSSDPVLHPKGQPGIYVNLELRNSGSYKTRIYYDSYRFNQSDSVTVSSCPPAYTACAVHQPTSHQDVIGFQVSRHF